MDRRSTHFSCWWNGLGRTWCSISESRRELQFSEEGYGKKEDVFLFLYVWQTMIQAHSWQQAEQSDSAQYCTYLYPFSPVEQKIISGAVVLFLIFLLYRKIETIGKIGVVMWAAVLITISWMIAGGLTAHSISTIGYRIIILNCSAVYFFVALGQASVKTIYSYLGYYNVCHLGEKSGIRRKIFRAVFLFPLSDRISLSGDEYQRCQCYSLATSSGF